MNKQEYAAYESWVRQFMEREGLANLTTISTEDGENAEPYFSWWPCECCRRSLGGDRYGCNGYIPATGEVSTEFSICPDCMYYAEYGRLDDQTMLSIEQDAASA